ncbi:MAG: DNA double-strand break repair nuclease NurA [Promethearchaeota archaeon]
MNSLNKLFLHPDFKKTINEIRKINLTITKKPIEEKINFESLTFPSHGRIKLLENIGKHALNEQAGQKAAKKFIFSGYDESKLKFLSLEGSAFFTAHSFVLASGKEYIPVNYLSFYFYTKAKAIKKNSIFIKYSKDHSADSNRDYAIERRDFLSEWAVGNSILFIDGPLIGGQMTNYTLNLVNKLHIKSIIPIFFVKNSESNLVTDNISEFKNRYNSDMHWAYKNLNPGQRTDFFLYTDKHNAKNAKIFCYLKAFDLSPQRIEFHLDTYKIYNNQIEEIMNLIYFLLLVHGDKKNPQIRPIAIAEKYARKILSLVDTYNLIKSSGLVPTMNQERFGG